MEPLSEERTNVLYSDNERKPPVYQHQRRLSEETTAFDCFNDSPTRSESRLRLGRNASVNGDRSSLSNSPEPRGGKRQARDTPPRQARATARKGHHSRSRSVDANPKAMNLSSSQVEKLENIFLKLLEEKETNVGDSPVASVVADGSANEGKTSGKGKWGSVLGKFLGRSPSGSASVGAAQNAVQSVDPPDMYPDAGDEPVERQLSAHQQQVADIISRLEFGESSKAYKGSLGRTSGRRRKSQVDTLADEKYDPINEPPSMTAVGASIKNPKNEGSGDGAATSDETVNITTTNHYVVEESISDSELTNRMARSLTPLSASAQKAAQHMFPVIDESEMPAVVTMAPRRLGESREECARYDLPAQENVGSVNDEVAGQVSKSGQKVVGEFEFQRADSLTPNSVLQEKTKVGQLDAQVIIPNFKMVESSDSEYEWGNISPASRPVLAAISELEIKALKAITSPGEVGTGGGHSAETLRQMAAAHRQETNRDSEILLALATAAEADEKAKKSAEEKAQAMAEHGNQNEYFPPWGTRGQTGATEETVSLIDIISEQRAKGSSIARAALEILGVAKSAKSKESRSTKYESQIATSAYSASSARGKAIEVEPLIAEVTAVQKLSKVDDRASPRVKSKVHSGRPIAAGFQSEVAVTILPPPPTKFTESRSYRAWRLWEDSAASERAPLAGHGTSGAGHTEVSSSSVVISWWDTAVTKATILSASAAQGLSHMKSWISGDHNRVAPGDVPPPTPRKDGFKVVPASEDTMPGDKDPEETNKGWAAFMAHWICDGRVLLSIAILALLFALVLFFTAGSSSSRHPSVDVSAPLVVAPPPASSTSSDMPPSDIPTCQGRCCSANSPVVPLGVPTMPSMWWSNQMTDGAKIQLRSLSSNQWWSPEPTSGRWTTLGAYADNLDSTKHMVVTRVSATEVRLRTPEGYFVAAHTDGSVRADQIVKEPTTLFTVEKVPGSDAQIQLRASDGKLLSSKPDGSLARTHNPQLAETFDVREVMAIPAKRGVNLGNWFVAEEWMDPGLFITIPIFIDGLSIQLQSVYYGAWITAKGSTGMLNCSVEDPGSWETFQVRDLGDGVYQLRSKDYLFVRAADGGEGGLFADQETPGAEGYENFTLVFNPLDPTEFMMKASNGNFLVVNDDGSVTATVKPETLNLAPGRRAWNGPTVFGYNETEGVRGEWQLSHYLGSRTEQVLEDHRKSWITEEDFAWLSDNNINAVRIPVGYWTAEGEESEYPFAAGAVPYLDMAFEWAEKYGMDVYLSLNGAPGSQNGLEHSGSRDGVPAWASDPTNIERTVKAIDWFASRYANSSAFYGISVLNEPDAETVHLNVLKRYYVDAYHAVRKHSACAFVGIQPRIGGDPYELDELMSRDAYTNTLIERHFFNLFNGRFNDMSVQNAIDFISMNRTGEIEEIQDDSRQVTVGAWSLALPEHMEPTDADYVDLGTTQLNAYSTATGGWFFWSYKLARYEWSAWDFRESVAKGWLRQMEGGGW